jgi:two-component system cell cycle sensor histidine kinase/response regulator CckA
VSNIGNTTRVSGLAGIGWAILTSGAFLTLSVLARNWLALNVYIVLIPAVVIGAWLGGRRAGILSTMIMAAGTAYYHMEPFNSFSIEHPSDILHLGSFAVAGCIVAWVSGTLQEDRAILTATLLSIGDAVVATDRAGRVRTMNRAAESLTGWTKREAFGRPLEEVFRIFQADTGESVKSEFQAVLSERRVANLLDNISLLSKSGRRIPVEDSMAPVETRAGCVSGAVLVFRDASKRKQQDAALRESELLRSRSQRMETVGRLAAGVAHDFNNLLTVINGYSAMLLAETSPGDPRRDWTGAILAAGERAAEVVHQLLVFSRGSNSKHKQEDLNSLVRRAAELLRRLIRSDIQITLDTAKEPLLTMADAGAIDQVVLNLALNARDAMPHGGTLGLETYRAEDAAGKWVVLSVADTGEGMDQQTREHIFEPFFTTKEVGKGTGLGLSIVFGIVQQHGGHVSTESESGKGATFRVFLPAMEPGAQELSEQSLPATVLQTGAGTVLVVEDHHALRKMTADILAGLGYSVIEAGDASQAEQAVSEYPGPIGLLLTDLMMPGLSGVDLFNRVAIAHPSIKVLFMSGYIPEDIGNRLPPGADLAFLAKPFTPEQLALKVAEMIKPR